MTPSPTRWGTRGGRVGVSARRCGRPLVAGAALQRDSRGGVAVLGEALERFDVRAVLAPDLRALQRRCQEPQRAGTPMTQAPSGTGRVTTAPAPTTASRPTWQPARMVALAPM